MFCNYENAKVCVIKIQYKSLFFLLWVHVFIIVILSRFSENANLGVIKIHCKSYQFLSH